MDNKKILLQVYDLLSSLNTKKKQEQKQDNDITKTLNEINLLPANNYGKEVYIDETKKEITGGKERKIQVMYY